jgi:GT2 family glycosyltransferase
MIDDRVTIVVLTCNRRDEVLRTLARVVDAYPVVPIVVVDNGSADGTAPAIAAHHPEVTLVRLASNVGAAGRNTGLATSTTPYVAFCDDDTWWRPGAIERAVDVLDAYPRLAAVTARVVVGESEREDPTNHRMAASPLPNVLGVPGTALIGLLAGACVVRRDAFIEAGGYHPRFFLGREEALLAIDLAARGWHMAYVPGATVCHWPSPVRDSAARRRLMRRNALWCAWLRRPLRSALRATAAWFAESRHDGSLRVDLRDALAALPWLLRERRVVPSHVEQALRVLDRLDAVNGVALRAPASMQQSALARTRGV